MKDLYNMIKYVWQFLRKHKWIIYFFIGVSVLDGLLSMANTFLIGEFIDQMLVDRTAEAIVKCAIVFVILNVVSFVSCYFAKVNGQYTMEVSVNECQKQLLEHLESSSMKYINRMGTAALMKRVYTDVYMLVIFVINISAQVVQNIFVLCVALISIFSLDMISGVAVLVEMPIIIVLYRFFQKKLLEREQEVAKLSEGRYAKLHEMLLDVGHIKRNQIYTLLENRFQNATKETIKSLVKSEQVEYIYNIIKDNMDVFLRVFLFFYGGISVIEQKMSIGEFTIIYSYVSMVTSSCSFFLDLGKNIQSNKAHFERIKEITDVPKETNGEIKVEKIENISFSDVDFGYSENELVVKDFSHTFTSGNLYAIIGENGCGKSTIATMALGMYIDEFKGDISINGISQKELDMRKIREEKMGVCEQEPFLIDDTIRYNMIYSNDRSKDEKLMHIAETVSFASYLKNSDKGLDTCVGQGGNNLSGGQKQKTALVKVFYKNPDVMILDEPTSAMDAEGQERLIRYLTEIKKDKIIIIVTHDPVMIESADEVIRM